MADFVFLDTETLGLDPYAPIWELAAIRVSDEFGIETDRLHLFVEHDRDPWLDDLPENFQHDYLKRYDPAKSVSWKDAAEALVNLMNGRPFMVGAVPSFDAERIARQWLEPLGIERPWHYHLMDIENVVLGWLTARMGVPHAPWKSDELSAAIGVNPADYPRHTAMGDVRWTMAQWSRVTGKLK